MGYLILATIIGIMIFIFIKFFHFRLISPTILIYAVFTLSLIAAAIGEVSWNTEHDINLLTYAIIIGGLLAIGLGESTFNNIVKRSAQKKYNAEIRVKKSPSKEIKVHPIWYILTFIILALTIVLIVHNLNRICAERSCAASTIFQKINFYRFNSSMFSLDPAEFDFFTKQLVKMSYTLAMVFSYIFVNNIFAKKKLHANLINCLPIVFAITAAMLQSGRGSAVKLITGFIIIYIIIAIRNRVSISKLLKRTIVVVAVAMPIFYLSLPLVGRQTSASFVDYTTFYLGSPVPSLNYYLENPTSDQTDYVGQTTFRGIYKITDRLGFTSENMKDTLPFIKLGGLNSNVYTGFYRSFTDFGIIGVIFMAYITGLIFALLNYLATHRENPAFLIFYSLYISCVLDFFRDDTIFTYIISSSTIVYIILIYISCKVLLPNKKLVSQNEPENE